MAKPLSNDLKELIIKDFEDGQKQVDIAKKYRKHPSTISRTIGVFHVFAAQKFGFDAL